MSQSLVHLRGASLGYRDHIVLTDVDLDIVAGDFLAIVGANGSGKSTLLRSILGLERVVRGTLKVHAESLGYVPQREHLDAVFPLTVEEVVRMGAFGRLRGWRRMSRADRLLAEECLERVHLQDQRRRLFAELSGGQRQRVLIARALLERPQLLLLDEPISGVDAKNQRWILELLREFAAEEGRAVLLVTHDVSATRRIAREGLHVADGRVRRAPIDDAATSEVL